MRPFCAALLALGLATSAASADSVTVSFDRITNNSSQNPEDQFVLIVANQQITSSVDTFVGGTGLTVGAGQVVFRFINDDVSGAIASSIADIYFDDGGTLASPIDAILGLGSGVAFSVEAKPGDLPSGNNATPPFVTTGTLSADSNSPVAPNGVNPGEWVELRLNLAAGKTFADVVAALTRTNANPDTWLRLGLHVQAIGRDGESDGFVSNPPTVPPTSVPAPPSLVLMGVGAVGCLGGHLLRLRKRNGSKA